MSVIYNKTEPPFGPIVNGTQIVFFEYLPNEAAAWIFVVLFFLAAVVHLGLLIWLRAWHFLPLTLGAVGEGFGYYRRVQAHKTPNVAGPFIMQNILILGCAPLIAATVYMTLGRYIRVFQLRDRIVIPPRLMTFVFVTVDLGCFVTQVFGSAAPASGDPQGIALGKTLIIGGLITQLAALCLFLILTLVSDRLAKNSRSQDDKVGSIADSAPRYFQVTYWVAGAMLLRSLVRGIEYLQGDGGFIISHEAFVYVLDGVPMVFVAAVYVFVHPGKLLRDAARVGGTEEHQELANYRRLSA
ncbi:Protein RTA1 [Colletotrichum siamense]|uniref:Protein RTA1 n=1 Tax=Colletotrichum siamense TaxID=690259 RepID=A0A9P5BMR6_COLSI|nr:Protein RTA1 [Colletotrichum siamense]KAF4844487.1 Protein RTA1 [Colletotrichum siamense]